MNVNHLFHSLLLAAAVAALPVGSVFAADVFPVRTSRGGYPLIIPRPKEFRAAPGTFALPAQLTVSVWIAPGAEAFRLTGIWLPKFPSAAVMVLAVPYTPSTVTVTAFTRTRP